MPRPADGRCMTEVSSDELLRRLRNDDTAALDIVLQRHWAPLVAYLARWLGSVDAAEDVAQRTFLRLWDRRKDWRPGVGSLRALLFRIGRNFAISDQRSLSARLRAADRWREESAERRDRTPLDTLENRELGCALEKAIAALPDRRREVFILRCIHGLPYQEIADVMGISQQTVANQLSRAMATLRQSLADFLAR